MRHPSNPDTSGVLAGSYQTRVLPRASTYTLAPTWQEEKGKFTFQ